MNRAAENRPADDRAVKSHQHEVDVPRLRDARDVVGDVAADEADRLDVYAGLLRLGQQWRERRILRRGRIVQPGAVGVAIDGALQVQRQQLVICFRPRQH